VSNSTDSTENTTEKVTGNTESNLELDLENSEVDSKPETGLEVAPPLENSESNLESNSETDYVPDNAAFDEFTEEATKTIEQARIEGKELDTPKPVVDPMAINDDDAVGMAVFGIMKVTEYFSESTGNKLDLPPAAMGIMATLCAPLVQKYGPTIKKYIANTDGVDLEGYVPEYLAAGSAAALGGWMYYQNSTQNKKLKAVAEIDKDVD